MKSARGTRRCAFVCPFASGSIIITQFFYGVKDQNAQLSAQFALIFGQNLLKNGHGGSSGVAALRCGELKGIKVKG